MSLIFVSKVRLLSTPETFGLHCERRRYHSGVGPEDLCGGTATCRGEEGSSRYNATPSYFTERPGPEVGIGVHGQGLTEAPFQTITIQAEGVLAAGYIGDSVDRRPGDRPPLPF
jgi:hypothetical protein